MMLQEGENPMTALTRDDGDVGDSQKLSLPQLVEALNQAEHQFLEAKSRYLKLKRLVYLRRIQERRHLQELEELSRLGQHQDQAQANDPESDTCSRLNQELNDNTLWLRTLKELLLVRLTR